MVVLVVVVVAIVVRLLCVDATPQSMVRDAPKDVVWCKGSPKDVVSFIEMKNFFVF